MHHLRNLLGYFIAGVFAMYLWPIFVDFLNMGVFGNWIAPIFIIGPMWYLNHYIGLIKHDEEMAFIDMAFGIGFAGIFKGLFIGVGYLGFMQSLPTLILLILGGSFGGFMATLVEKKWLKS